MCAPQAHVAALLHRPTPPLHRQESELCLHGRGRRVTVDNLSEYLTLLVRRLAAVFFFVVAGARAITRLVGCAMTWQSQKMLVANVAPTLVPLVAAFEAMVPPERRRLLSPETLRAAVLGTAAIDVDDWRAFAVVEPPHLAHRYRTRPLVFLGSPQPPRPKLFCRARSPVVAWFWAYAAGLAPAGRASLLAWATTFAAPPAGGFAALPHPFVLHVSATQGDAHHPTANTCFATLHLPLYSSPAVLAARLDAAVQYQAFTLA